jgi:hypothetical protein
LITILFSKAGSFLYCHDEVPSSSTNSILEAETDLEEWLSPPVIDANMRWDSNIVSNRQHRERESGRDRDRDRDRGGDGDIQPSNGAGQQHPHFVGPYFEDTPLSVVNKCTCMCVCMCVYMCV